MPEHFALGFLGGIGPQGRGLALRLALAGHEVLLGSRDEGRAKNVVEELLGGRSLPIRGVSSQQAANQAEALFVVVPYDGQATLLAALAPALAEKIVVNMINPLTRDAHGPYLRPVPDGKRRRAGATAATTEPGDRSLPSGASSPIARPVA
jgi:8-hydroxy-5-deazaflavin:NADPH oxidoreductase